MDESDPAWDLFAALQREADPQSIDRSLARDEALDEILNEVVTNPAPDTHHLRKRYNSLCRNRLSKQKHRRELDRLRSRATHRRGGSDFGSVLLTAPDPDAFNEVAYQRLTDLLRTVLLEEELALLLEIANGNSYADMAHNRNMTVPSLKSRVFRVRKKVRNSRLSPALRCWLRR